MIHNLQVQDRIRLENDQIFTVHKIVEVDNKMKKIYGLSLNPNCLGNFEWYDESGKPVTYWANKYLVESVFKPKTITEILKKSV